MSYLYADRAFKKMQLELSTNTITETYVNNGTITCETLNNLQLPEDMTSLWIKGPSGIGKTTWALRCAPKPALFVRHVDTLREFRNGYHKSIIFDDMSFSHLPRQAQIDIVDRFHPQQVHIRYAVAYLPVGISKIFLSNDLIFNYDEAINRRLTKVFIEIN